MGFKQPKITTPAVVQAPPPPLAPSQPLPASAQTSATGETTPPVAPGQAQLLSQLRRKPDDRGSVRMLLGG